MSFTINFINQDNTTYSLSSVIKLDIKHEEAHYAIAKLILKLNKDFLAYISIAESFCLINYNDQTIFKGYLLSLPTPVGDFGLYKMHLIARPKDAHEQLTRLTQDAPAPNPLFNLPLTIENALLSTPHLVYCNPITHDLKFSHISAGAKTIEIINTFFADSLNVTYVSPPLDEIEINLEYNWDQKAIGDILFDKSIAISSINFDQFMEDLTNRIRTWKDEGYKPYMFIDDLKSKPAIITHQHKGSDPNLPPHETVIGEFDHQEAKIILGFIWNLYQRRSERLSIILKQRTQNLWRKSSLHKKSINFLLQSNPQMIPLWEPFHSYLKGDVMKLRGNFYRAIYSHDSHLRVDFSLWEVIDEKEAITNKPLSVLQDTPRIETERQNNYIPFEDLKDRLSLTKPDFPPAKYFDEGNSSFFDSAEGSSAINYAIEIGKAYLEYSARSVVITFRGSIKDLGGITLDDSILLKHKEFKDGKATGKVISYQLFAEEGNFYIELKIACQVGLESGKDLTVDIPEVEGKKIIDKENYKLIYQEIEGVVDPYALDEDSCVAGIFLFNNAEEQMNALRDSYADTLQFDKKTIDFRDKALMMRYSLLEDLSYYIRSKIPVKENKRLLEMYKTRLLILLNRLNKSEVMLTKSVLYVKRHHLPKCQINLI